MKGESVTEMKSEVKMEEDNILPELIKNEIKEEDELPVKSEGFYCPIYKIRYIKEDTFIEHAQCYNSTSVGQKNRSFSKSVITTDSKLYRTSLLETESVTVTHNTLKSSEFPY